MTLTVSTMPLLDSAPQTPLQICPRAGAIVRDGGGGGAVEGSGLDAQHRLRSIPALRRRKQVELCEFQISYIVTHCPKAAINKVKRQQAPPV